MNKRERVLQVLSGKAADCTPVSFWFHFSGENTKGQACVDAHLAYYRRCGLDYIKIMSDSIDYHLPAGFEPKTAADWKKLKPQGRGSSYIEDAVWRCKRLNEELQGECCTFYNIFAPFSLMRQVAGDETVMQQLREDPESVLEGLEAIATDCATLCRAVVEEGGCTGIYLSLQGGELGRFTYDEYRSMIMPSDLMALNAAKAAGGQNICHLCGWAGDRNDLNLWKDYPADAFNWAIFIDLLSIQDAKTFFGGKPLIGGFDNRKTSLIYNGTKEEIQAFAKKLVEENKGYPYIVGADCTVPNTIDLDHLTWAVEAVHGA